MAAADATRYAGAMPLDALFRIASTVALAGWVILALAPLRRRAAALTARLLVALLCGGYAAVLGHALATGPAPQLDFNSLDGVMAMLRTREAALAGWVHYLAFDLFAGSWEVEAAPAMRVPHVLLLPCLVLTFVAGPVGLLAFLAVAAVRF